MALKDFANGRTDVYKIDPKVLQVRPDWNSRDFTDPANQQHVEELAKSIAEVGVREPLKVFVENDVPYITNGECRYRAVMLCIERGIEIKTVPVMGEERFSNDADRLFTQFVSNSGKPLSTIEEARIYKKLIDLGWKQTDIAKKVGKSSGRISQVLSVLTLPAELQTAISEGVVSPAIAKSMVAAETSGLNPEARQLTLQTARDEGRKVRAEDVAPVARFTFAGCFNDSEIDDGEDAVDSGMITIKMPLENWNWIRKSLKL